MQRARLGSAEPDVNKPRFICKSTLPQESWRMGQLTYRLVTRPLFPVRGTSETQASVASDHLVTNLAVMSAGLL
jgi:hypothetical protein